jgi:tRNA-(ms[2]io[6]A)-hydroxylase
MQRELPRELPLAAPTSPGWVEVAAADLDALLIDHAHCELKAAANAKAMAVRFAGEPRLVRDLTVLAREERRHFELVHARVRERGRTLPAPRTDRYVRRLARLVRRGGGSRAALLDQLLLCGFIEARSCERFRLLAGAPLASSLRTFYAELAGAEARHYELFFEHAFRLNGEDAVGARIREVAELEAALVRDLPLEPRMH